MANEQRKYNSHLSSGCTCVGKRELQSARHEANYRSPVIYVLLAHPACIPGASKFSAKYMKGKISQNVNNVPRRLEDGPHFLAAYS